MVTRASQRGAVGALATRRAGRSQRLALGLQGPAGAFERKGTVWKATKPWPVDSRRGEQRESWGRPAPTTKNDQQRQNDQNNSYSKNNVRQQRSSNGPLSHNHRPGMVC